MPEIKVSFTNQMHWYGVDETILDKVHWTLCSKIANTLLPKWGTSFEIVGDKGLFFLCRKVEYHDSGWHKVGRWIWNLFLISSVVLPLIGLAFNAIFYLRNKSFFLAEHPLAKEWLALNKEIQKQQKEIEKNKQTLQEIANNLKSSEENCKRISQALAQSENLNKKIKKGLSGVFERTKA